MKKHFAVIAKNTWGGGSSLYEAMDNACVTVPSLFTSGLSAIESYYDDPDGLKGELEDIIKYPENWENGGIFSATVVITDSNRWKFNGCSEIDGAPRYTWVGNGKAPGNLEDTVLYITIDKGTGAISLIEEEKA